MSPSFFTYRSWWVPPQILLLKESMLLRSMGLEKNYRNATGFEGINSKIVYAQYSNLASSEYKGGNGLV